MKWKQISGIILVSTASLSCVAACYLFFWLVRARSTSKTLSNAIFGYIDAPLRKETHSQHKTLLEFIIRMSFFIMILSIANLFNTISYYYQFVPQTCSTDWNQVDNLACWFLRFCVSFSTVASISWYFMMTAAIFLSLHNRTTILHDTSFTRYQITVITVSLAISVSQLVIALKTKDFQFNGAYTYTPLVTTEAIYLFCTCLSMLYIRCCYPFYLTKSDKFRLIFLICVFILLWIFPAVYDVLPESVGRLQSLLFVRQMCQSSIGLIISISWLASVSYETRSPFESAIFIHPTRLRSARFTHSTRSTCLTDSSLNNLGRAAGGGGAKGSHSNVNNIQASAPSVAATSPSYVFNYNYNHNQRRMRNTAPPQAQHSLNSRGNESERSRNNSIFVDSVRDLHALGSNPSSSDDNEMGPNTPNTPIMQNVQNVQNIQNKSARKGKKQKKKQDLQRIGNVAGASGSGPSANSADLSTSHVGNIPNHAVVPVMSLEQATRRSQLHPIQNDGRVMQSKQQKQGKKSLYQTFSEKVGKWGGTADASLTSQTSQQTSDPTSQVFHAKSGSTDLFVAPNLEDIATVQDVDASRVSQVSHGQATIGSNSAYNGIGYNDNSKEYGFDAWREYGYQDMAQAVGSIRRDSISVSSHAQDQEPHWFHSP